LDEGDNERALAAYMQAIKINPKYDFAYSEIGYIKHLQKDIPSSIEYCMKAISLNNKDASSYYRLATIYNDQGDSEKALQYCSRSIEADPENGDRYYPMAILVARQDRSAALPYLQKAVDLNTTYDYCYILLASFYVRQNQFEKAQQALEKAIENKKAIGADGFNGLAWCYVCQDINQEEAVLMADYARHLAPDKMEIVDTLNKAFINLGNKRMKENNFLMALFCYYMSIYVWIDSFFSGFLFLFIAGFLFLQLIPRLFFRYLIKKDALYYMFLWFIPLGKISFKNIEEIRLLNRFAGLKYIIHWNWRNRLIGKEVLIRKKAGLIRTIILTPGKPAVFVEEIKARVDNNFTPIATLVDSNG
jgi:tetratricopeptide (TPR) repeat protein